MAYPELHNRSQDFAGTTGLVLLGEDTALSYTRDGETDSYPHHVDLAGGGRQGQETPFQTFRRELGEEFALEVTAAQIVYAKRYRALIDASRMGYFVVAKLPAAATEQITFGDEGSGYQLTTLPELLAMPNLIPRRKQQIQTYLCDLALTGQAQPFARVTQLKAATPEQVAAIRDDALRGSGKSRKRDSGEGLGRRTYKHMSGSYGTTAVNLGSRRGRSG